MDGRILDCKLGMHAKCFDEIQKIMIPDPGRGQNGGSNWFDILKHCCHNSLVDLCAHTDGEWWKLQKLCHQKDVGKYSDIWLICLKQILIGCVTSKKGMD